jgi:hypothetical protein
MPRYFFNIVMGKVVVYDRKGRDLTDAKAARLLALQNARELLSQNARKKPLKHSECSVDVIDPNGELLFTVPFTELRFERL